MKEYLKSEQYDKYCELVRYKGGTYIAKFHDEYDVLPENGVVVGTYYVSIDGGYNELDGTIYDECYVDFY